MPSRLPALSSLRAFEAAARLMSFKLAAEELAVTATAISHRIKALEEALGCALFVRKTRAVALTEQGLVLHGAVREGFETIAAGVARLRVRTRASVTLSTTPAFASKWLLPRMPSFQAAHPDIDLHVHASNQPVDLRAGSADLAVRYGQGRYAGLGAKLLWHDRFAAVASPSLGIRKTADVMSHPLIHFDWHRPLPVDLTWPAWARAAGLTRWRADKGTRYSEESHAIQAAVAGQGVALLSLALVHEELKLGLLAAPVTPVLEGLAYHVVRPARMACSDEMLAVEAWLLEMAAADACSDPINRCRIMVPDRGRLVSDEPRAHPPARAKGATNS